MVIELDTASATPLYIQLRNQIVIGIGRGEFKRGDSLPTIRALAQELEVNNMTVNKTYMLLKQEGFIEIDRRHGAKVCEKKDAVLADTTEYNEKLELLVAESAFAGIDKQEFMEKVEALFTNVEVSLA